MSEKEPGAADKIKGAAKEAAGEVMGDEAMKAEGRAEREGAVEPDASARHPEEPAEGGEENIEAPGAERPEDRG